MRDSGPSHAGVATTSTSRTREAALWLTSHYCCAGSESGGGADAIEVPGTGEVVADPAAGSVAWFEPGMSALSIGIRVPSCTGAGIGALTSRIPFW